MEFELTSLAFVGVVLLGAGVRSTFGFADALIAMPLLLMLFDSEVAAPLMALNSVTLGAVISLMDWKHISFRAVGLLVLCSAVGIPIGMLLLTQLPQGIVQGVLAIMLIVFGVMQLSGRLKWRLNSDRWAIPFGFVGGLLAGAYNTPGPPLVVFASLRAWPAEKFRATMQAYSFPIGLFVIALHVWFGRLTMTVGRYYLLAIPTMALAIFVGAFLNRRLAKRGFEKLVYVLVVALGLALLTQAIATSVGE